MTTVVRLPGSQWDTTILNSLSVIPKIVKLGNLIAFGREIISAAQFGLLQITNLSRRVQDGTEGEPRPFYREGMILRLGLDVPGLSTALSMGTFAEATILKIFEPITMSAVMEVELRTTRNPFSGKKAVLKLYDRRVGPDFRDEDSLYSREAEVAWEACVREGKAPGLFRRLEDNHRREMMGESISDSESDDDDSDTSNAQSSGEVNETRGTKGPKILPRERLGKREGELQWRAHRQFLSESLSYRKMQRLQGRCVPTFIGQVRLRRAYDRLPAEFFGVSGVLLEHIEGFNLSHDLTTLAPQDAWQSIVQQAVDAANDINDCGVVNSDCQPRNVLVDAGTWRPFHIDFAQSLTDDDVSGEEFERIRQSTDNQGAIGVVMKHKLQKNAGVNIQVRYQNHGNKA